mmetsp:Transcript_8676/g.30893  ORF Transcript_8676/g.30893 Transcript_8676/m.30893 type:complete len:409 (-) Transcript_8676:445-1671(-)
MLGRLGTCTSMQMMVGHLSIHRNWKRRTAMERRMGEEWEEEAMERQVAMQWVREATIVEKRQAEELVCMAVGVRRGKEHHEGIYVHCTQRRKNTPDRQHEIKKQESNQTQTRMQLLGLVHQPPTRGSNSPTGSRPVHALKLHPRCMRLVSKPTASPSHAPLTGGALCREDEYDFLSRRGLVEKTRVYPLEPWRIPSCKRHSNVSFLHLNRTLRLVLTAFLLLFGQQTLQPFLGMVSSGFDEASMVRHIAFHDQLFSRLGSCLPGIRRSLRSLQGPFQRCHLRIQVLLDIFSFRLFYCPHRLVLFFPFRLPFALGLCISFHPSGFHALFRPLLVSAQFFFRFQASLLHFVERLSRFERIFHGMGGSSLCFQGPSFGRGCTCKVHHSGHPCGFFHLFHPFPRLFFHFGDA